MFGRNRDDGHDEPASRDEGAVVALPTDGYDGGGGGRPTPTGDAIERLHAQLALITESIPGATASLSEHGGEIEFIYVEGQILIRDEDVERVRRIVDGEAVEPQINGLTVFRLAGTTTLEALDTIDEKLGSGVATPNHIFYVTPVGRACPATEPVPVPVPLPDPPVSDVPRDLGGGAGTVVAIVDTGLISALVNPAHPWLHGVTGTGEPYDPTDIGPYVGHGTFVAGVLRCMAPHAEVHVGDLLNLAGAVTESHMLSNIRHMLRWEPDVISMSAGCTTRHNLPPLGFVSLWEHRLRHQKGLVLVAAAGNSSSRTPFWPAAFPWAVSVGALDRHGHRADYSDCGSWVDVYALGSEIVNAYPDGTFHYREPPHLGETAHFTNEMALWSGTSFSTPTVAGMIAARMSRTGQNGRDAADSILRLARAHAKIGVGPIADPAMTYDPDPRGW